MSESDETKTDELASKNQAEGETPEPHESQTVESTETETSEVEGTDDDKKTSDSFYEEELARLRKEKEEKERQLEQKNRALQAEKKRRRELEQARETEEVIDNEESLEERITRRLRGELLEQEAERYIGTLSKNPAERELIKHHYRNSIVKSGNVEDDVLSALALANKRRINDLRVQDSEDDRKTDASIASMGGGTRSGRHSSRPKTLAERELETMLPESMRKNSKQYLKK